MKKLFFLLLFYPCVSHALSYESGVPTAGISTLGISSVTASGTAYSLTASSATLDFGTTDPTITLTQPGTYLIIARVDSKYTGATFVANQTLNFKLRRTNNTPTDLVTTAITTRIITTITDACFVGNLPSFVYTTSNSNDILEIAGFLSAVPSIGSIDVIEANIVAVKLF